MTVMVGQLQKNLMIIQVNTDNSGNLNKMKLTYHHSHFLAPPVFHNFFSP